MIDTGGQGRWAAAVLACLVSLWPAFAAGAADETPIRWDVESLARVVKPMRHDMKGRMPLVLWNFPLPRNDELVKQRADGSLRKHIDTLAARGIVPTVEMGWAWTPAGAMAMARTLVDAEAIWSGRKLPGRCLVRAVSLGKDDARVRVGVAEGVTVELDAPRAGATYLISAAGAVRKVASGRM